jgi:hypothetical protein
MTTQILAGVRWAGVRMLWLGGLAALMAPAPAASAAAVPWQPPARHAAITGTVSGTWQPPGSRRSCPWKFTWQVNTGSGWDEVRWNVNPCGFYIQNLGFFTDLYEHHYTVPSGHCKRVGLNCRSSAHSWTDSVDKGQRRIKFSNWYPWRTYWP